MQKKKKKREKKITTLYKSREEVIELFMDYSKFASMAKYG